MCQGSAQVNNRGAEAPTNASIKDLSKLGQKKVVEAKNQTSKAWFVLAIAIGSLVLVGVGGFGAIGLLQSHGVISLPQSMQWLSSAIGTVGSTPHFWSLWSMTSGAIIVGVSLIAVGSYKIHQIRKEQQQWSLFGDHFEEMGTQKTTYDDQPHMTYIARQRGDFTSDEFIPEDRGDRFFIVIRNADGALSCTGRLDAKQRIQLSNFLDTKNFKENTGN